MKKVLFVLLMIGMIISSCTKVQEKPFLATDVDSVIVKDGAENKVKVYVKYQLGFDSAAAINSVVRSEEELSQFVDGIYWNLKNECKYPRTFKPSRLLGLNFTDTLAYSTDTVYRFNVFAYGTACNAFGVEQEISDYFDLLAWKESEVLEDGMFTYIHIYPNEEFWVNIISKGIGEPIVLK